LSAYLKERTVKFLKLTILFILVTVILKGQDRIIPIKVELNSSFDEKKINDWSGLLIGEFDTVYFDPCVEKVNVKEGIVYKLTINSFKNAMSYVKRISITSSTKEILIQDRIGKIYSVEELHISEKDAIADIRGNDVKIFAYHLMTDKLVEIAMKYGYPISLLNNASEKYGFKFVRSGCFVSEARTQAFSRYNNQVILYLNSKLQNDWIDRFEGDVVDRLIMIQGNRI